jgi:Na+/melibiose symporter-like transporter
MRHVALFAALILIQFYPLEEKTYEAIVAGER